MIFAEILSVYIDYCRTRTEHFSVRVHNSLTVDDNLWALKFGNFPEFQNVIVIAPPTPQCHYDAVRTKIDMWLTS